MPAHTLYDFQQQMLDEARHLIADGVSRLVMVAPTGAGKTQVAAAIIEGAIRMGNRVIFLAHRKELIDQCSARLTETGVEHGIIRANDPRRKPWLRCHVASVPTLIRRSKPPADILIIDECHRARAKSYEDIVRAYPNAVVIGLTATPIRADGRGLGGRLFQAMVQGPSTPELIQRGFLVPARVFAPPPPDLKGVHVRGGDYKQEELAAAVDKPKLVGDIVTHWKQHASDRLTVAFAVSVQHSKHIVEQFRAVGVRAEHLDGETPESEREAILERLRRGQTQLLSNVQVLTEGWDCPPVSCVILARPTTSLGLYLQMVGRSRRLWPGKTDCLILDHAGCCRSWMGHPDDEREWELTEDFVAAKKKKAAKSVVTALVCERCWRAFPTDAEKCPECGWVPERGRKVQMVDGVLQEVRRETWYACESCKQRWTAMEQPTQCHWCKSSQVGTLRSKYDTHTIEHKKRYFLDLRREAQEKGYRPGYPVVRFRGKYGHMPERSWWSIPIGLEVQA